MRNFFITQLRGTLCVIPILSLMFLSSQLSAQCPSGTLGGSVFVDSDNNGINDSGESGQSGIMVRAYDSDNTWVGQSISDNAGQYSITGLTNGQSYRIEFGVGNGTTVSHLGADNNGDVQFVQAPYCLGHLGLTSGPSTCGVDTEIFLTCFVNGLGADSPNQETIIGLTNSFDATSPVNVYARQSETGSVWGLVYKEQSQEIFSSAFVKQHASLTTGGHDAIYRTTVNGTPSTSLFTKLSVLGQNTGQLSSNNSRDCSYGDQVGKVGLGGLAIDDSGSYLYVANLYNNSIVRVDAFNPTAANTVSYNVPSPGCSFNDFSVFAVKYYKGSLYVGVTCTGETAADESDTSIHVYEMNTTSGNFNLMWSDSYSRGFWSADNVDTRQTMQWLTDIDFTDSGDMLIALTDRIGHAFCNDNASRVDDQFGDLLYVSKVNGSWVLESNGVASGQVGTGVGNGEGPGGGEFFGDDFFPGNPTDHPDVALGSIFVRPGSGEVISAVFDPAFAAYSGGLHRYSTADGSKVASKELYNQNISDYFGKATGFGDIVAGCGPIAPSIGNYVWIDTNGDGIQNAGELPVANVTIELYNDSCSKIATTTTDNQGFYGFDTEDGIQSGHTYYVVLDPSLFDQNASSYTINNTAYFPTLANTSSAINSNLQFGEACTQFGHAPYVEAVAQSGANLTFDIGLQASRDFDLACMKVVANGSTTYGEIIEFEIQVYNQGTVAATEYEISDLITPAFEFIQSENPSWTYNQNVAKLRVTQDLLPGEVHRETIRLKLLGSDNSDDLINMAEISYTMDSNGNPNSDIDSSSDDDFYNDNGGVADSNTDNQLTGTGSIDEDDHDPAMVCVFDLALDNITRDPRMYERGEKVYFDITVYNQGNTIANSFEITDQFPTGFTFDQAANPGWTFQGGNIALLRHDTPLLPGSAETFTLVLTISSTELSSDLVQYAEISRFESAKASVIEDFDSTADSDMSNDNGGEFQAATDGEISDHGGVDEDDHDPAGVSVRSLDLALIKKTTETTFELGDKVTYTIEVHNQGTSDVKKIMLIDYLPEGTTLLDESWTYDASAGYAYKEVIFLSTFKPGQIYTDYIEIKLPTDGARGAYVNVAEIGEVYDVNNRDISRADIDSNADSILGNDSGGMAATTMDDYLLGDGNDDEDDSDPAIIFVPFLDVSVACECSNNATNAFDGYYREEITITSLSGQTWYLDEQFNFFDINSPVGAALDYATGPSGVNFVETPMGDGTSTYVLSGALLSGRAYSLRATNGSGVFLQSSGGGEACTYSSPIVTGSGLGAVCADGSTEHTYSVDASNPIYEGCDGFSWVLSGGGDFVNLPAGSVMNFGTGITGSGTGSNYQITVLWTDIGEHNLTLVPHCPDACVAPVSLPISVTTDDGPLACINEINVSLSSGCISEIEYQDLLVGDYPSDVAYQLMLTDASGQVIQNNTLTRDHLWTTVIAKVISPCSGNACWANINVEDKLAPQIQCGDIEIPCFLVDTYEPIVVDNCSSSEYRLIDETTTPLPCDSFHIKKVFRTYVAEDGFGNVSAPCTQTIRLLPLPVDAITIPTNYLVKDDTNLTCQGLVLNDEGNPDISMTGVPTIDGQPIFPITDLYCNAGIDYRDIVVNDFGCSKKIMRTWTIYDGCNDPLIKTQTIEIGDTRAPWVTCPADVTVSTTGGPGCEASYLVPLPEITDDCTVENFEIDLKFASGYLDNITAPQLITLASSDSTEVTYKVYDQCENLSECTFNVTVLDDVSPTAICDESSVVSLRIDGTAKAFPQTFDDGSFDDCGLEKLLVRRMNSNCDCGKPTFDDMHYLGQRGSRYYYLSSFDKAAFKAFSLTAAYGGMLLTLESEAEHQWVYEQVNAFIPGSQYYIALRDKNNSGDYTFENHLSPSFNAWRGGAPVAAEGQFVAVDENGEWFTNDGGKRRFVLEISDPCSFSESVPFCCADAGTEQMVVLRAIDNFGSYNECMVSVEVQDKVPPIVVCPDDVVLTCDTQVDLGDLEMFGIASATDSCVEGDVPSTVIDNRNQCGVGSIIRRFTASDASGSSQCDQVLSFENNDPYDFNATIWPEDFDTNLGCNFGALHPDNLDLEFAYPVYPTDVCDLVEGTFDDQIFSFAGPDSDACLKILRRWTVIDWCQLDASGFPMSTTYDQTIKVQNTEGPVITDGQCDDLTVTTLECDYGLVEFTVQAFDDCTAPEQLQNCLRIDIDSDGLFDIEDCLSSNVVSYSNKLPVGSHIALISFEDLCGNTTTCSKNIFVNGEKPPIAYCKDGLSVALEPMDLDGDGAPDNEMAFIFPSMIDAGSSHPCMFDFELSFCNNMPSDQIAFDCQDIGAQIVTLCVIDEFGNSASCNVEVLVQDNNDVDFCPEFDLALLKEIDPDLNGPFAPGDDITYRISLFNQGNQDAFNINLVDYVPDGLILNDPDWTLVGGNSAFLNEPIADLGVSWATSVDITFTIDPSFMGDCIINTAEIAGSTNAMGLDDLDSTADTDQTNDIQGGLHILDNTNEDEDDHDSEKINVIQNFDLALIKTLNVTNPGPFMRGDFVRFDITVLNQGTLDAYNVGVQDFVPTGLNLNDADWTMTNGIASLNTPIAFIPAGGQAQVFIDFNVDANFMGTSLTNNAEISAANGLNGPIQDTDSTPNSENGNVSDPNNDDVDLTDGSDDYDFETIMVGQNFDLALTKVLLGNQATNQPGDILTFRVTVFNQGTLDATDVQVTDYVPANLIFNGSPGWSAGVNPVATIGNLAAGQSDFVDIQLQIDPNFSGTQIVNNAEITSSANALGLADEDSTVADNAGTPNELDTDGDIDDAPDNPNDEDDFDPALITVECNLEPICSVIGQITVSLDAGGQAMITAAMIDNGSAARCDGSTVSLSLSQDSFDCNDKGNSNVVSVVVLDSAGNVSTDPTCQTTVNVIDEIDPFITCTDITTTLDSNGNPIIDLNQVVLTSGDNCSIVSTDLNPPLDVDICGGNAASVVLTDPCGNTGTCIFNVFIADEPPTAICVDNFTLSLGASGSVSINAIDLDNGSSDDCTEITFEATQVDFDCDDVGPNVITLSVFDNNVPPQSAQCQTTITIVDDNPPTAICQSVTVQLNDNGAATIATADIDNGSSDECGLAIPAFTLSQSLFGCENVNVSNSVVLTVTDVNGNVSTCSANVNVQDLTAPIITCRDEVLLDLDDTGNVSLSPGMVLLTSSDNCEIASESLNNTSFGCANKANATLVTATVTDVNGNSATCQSSVVVRDFIAPTCDLANNLVFDVVGDPPSVTFSLADLGFTFSDNCATVPGSATVMPNAFDCSNLGLNTVTVVIDDGCGNTGSCVTEVTIQDVSIPTCNVIPDVTFDLNVNGSFTLSPSDINISSSAGCDPNASIVLSQTNFDCSSITQNPTIVTLTVTAANGNSATCTSNVTVQDVISPTVNCVSPVVLDLDVNGVVNITSNMIIVNSSDNCAVVSEVIDVTSFDCEDKGDTVVTATISDASGNAATCQTTVTIRDVMAPTCTLFDNLVFDVTGDPPSVTLALTDVLATFTDNCVDAPVNATVMPNVFDCTQLGINTVTVTVEDECGNSTDCTTQVTIQDVSIPTCNVIPDVTFNLDVNGNFQLTPNDINISSSAGCDPNASVTVNPNFFGCNSIGLNPTCVTLTVTAANGNSATCKSNVTVLDVTPPVVECAPVTVMLDANGNATLSAAQVLTTSTDECGILSEVLDVTAFGCGDITCDGSAPVAVTVTVTDMNNNVSTCTADISVLDEINPTCTLTSGLVFDLLGMPPSVAISVDQVLATYMDNCPGPAAVSTITPAIFDCMTLGDQMVTVTVEDACGNSGTCTTTVSIADNSVPTCITQDITVSLDANGMYTLDASEIDNGSNAGCGTNVTLAASPTNFTCANLGTNTVTLMVTTSGGVSSNCTAVVTVIDDTDPEITCPADVTLACNSDLSDVSDFGSATAVDGCGSVSLFTALPVFNVNACNVGVVTRSFTATDSDGNTASCTQIITIDPPQTPLVEANITFPASPFVLDQCIPDPLNIDSGMPVVDLSGVDCSNVSIQVNTVDPTPNAGNECVNTLERTFTVIDSCQLNGTGGGVFTFVQTIMLNDLQGPDISCPADTTLILPVGATNCELFVDLPAVISDCTGVLGGSNNSPFANNNNIPDASGIYGGGVTNITVTGSDVCGNTSTCDYSVTIFDNTATIDTCKKIIEQIGSNGTSIVTIDQACVSIDGVCPASTYTLSYSATSNAVTSFIVDCDDTASGGVPSGISSYSVYLYAGTTLLDSCENILQVLDPQVFCTTPLLGELAGRVITEDFRSVSEVTLELQNMDMADVTGEDGLYAFSDIEVGNSYLLTPNKDMDYLNGISTLDLIMIQRHLLGIEKLDSPYKIIAADIDRSNTLNGVDLVELRKLILGIYEELPSNDSWRMVDAEHQFIDALNPFATPFPEEHIIRSMTQNMAVDFIGVKIGDVNSDAVSNLNDIRLDNRSSEYLEIEIEDEQFLFGESVDIDFLVEEVFDLEGLQMTLNFDPELVEINRFIGSELLNEAHVNLNDAENGVINISWNAPVDMHSIDVLFSLEVTFRSTAWTSNVFSISQKGLRPEAYYDNEIRNIKLSYDKQDVEVDNVILYQNNPNPWTQSTEVRFYLPDNDEFTLSIYNTDGRMVFTKSALGSKGMNIVDIDKDDILTGGIYYYELSSSDSNLTHKMLLIK